MLATSPTLTLDQLSGLAYPILAFPKYDGIRCITIPTPEEVRATQPQVLSQPFSRTLKLIPNTNVRAQLANLPGGLDGELMVIQPANVATVTAVDWVNKTVTMDSAPGDRRWRPFDEVTSAIMSHHGEPDFRYVVFDTFLHPEAAYEDRFLALASVAQEVGHPRVELAPFSRCESPAQVAAVYEQALAEGFEGLILRAPHGPYKYGRATLREQWMLKLKPKGDAEAEILEVIPLERNQNEATTDAFGRTERSSHKAGKVATELMGALRVRAINGPHEGRVFNIGTGFTDALRAEFWEHREFLTRGCPAVVRYSFSPDPSYELPRHPSYQGRRPEGA